MSGFESGIAKMRCGGSKELYSDISIYNVINELIPKFDCEGGFLKPLICILDVVTRHQRSRIFKM